MDCIFCKIVNGEIPSYKVYEDEHTFSFLDRSPVSEGHLLVIPKKHVSRLKDMDDENISNLMKGLKVVLNKIENISKSSNIGINQGKEAGQVVDHLHIHVIPRYENDGKEMWPGGKLTGEEAKEILEKLK